MVDLRAAGHHHVGIAVLDQTSGGADAVQAGGASRHDRQVRATHAVLDRQVTGDHVDDRRRHEERRNTARTALVVIFLLLFDHRQAADAGTDDDADAVGVLFGHDHAGILHGLDTGRHAVMDERIHVAGFLGRDVVLDVEAFDFTGKTGTESLRVKLGDGGNTGLALDRRGPRVGNIIAYRGYGAQAGNDNTTVFRTSQAILLKSIGR